MGQSTKLLILQLFNTIIGFATIFLVASNIPTDVYAIIGIYEVIVAFVVTFSNNGLDTYALRNVLNWRAKGEELYIKRIIIQSLSSRFILASLLLIPVFLYVYYISITKFEGNYFYLFILMGLSSVFSSLNSSLFLLLRAFNDYFLSAFLSSTISSIGRVLAVILFFKFGFYAYIGIILLLPLIAFLFSLYSLYRYILYKGKIGWKKSLLSNLKLSRHFTLSSYISYIFNFLDQLLVSLFFPPSILSSFSIGKKVVEVIKLFIENIFDPKVQKLVEIKNDIVKMKQEVNELIKLKNKLLVLYLFGLPLVVIFIAKVLGLVGLEKYQYLDYFIICIYISFLFVIESKVKYVYIGFFLSSKYYLKLTIVNAIVSVFCFTFVAKFVDIMYIYSYIGFTYLLIMLYVKNVYKEKVLKTIE